MTADALIADSRFWSIERVHYGHNGECNADGRNCWRMRIGAHIVDGCVTWYEGESFAEAIAKAERGLTARPHEFEPSWEPNDGSYIYVSCEVCGVEGHSHPTRPVLAPSRCVPEPAQTRKRR